MNTEKINHPTLSLTQIISALKRRTFSITGSSNRISTVMNYISRPGITYSRAPNNKSRHLITKLIYFISKISFDQNN
jgi:hypothetical protein